MRASLTDAVLTYVERDRGDGERKLIGLAIADFHEARPPRPARRGDEEAKRSVHRAQASSRCPAVRREDDASCAKRIMRAVADAANIHGRIEGDESLREVTGIGRDAIAAHAEHRLGAIVSIDRRAARTRITLVARRPRRVAKIGAAGALKNIAPDARHCEAARSQPALRLCASIGYCRATTGRSGDVLHPGERSEAQASLSGFDAGHILDRIDVDQHLRPSDIELHEIEDRRSPGDELRARTLADPLTAGLPGSLRAQRGRSGDDKRKDASRPPHLEPRALDRSDDIRIGGAPAQVAAHIFADLGPAFRVASSTQPIADIIWPGVQYPHWNASKSTNAFCIGWSWPSGPVRPSIVVTRRSRAITASVRQERTRRPSTCTVQAPHCP